MTNTVTNAGIEFLFFMALLGIPTSLHESEFIPEAEALSA